MKTRLQDTEGPPLALLLGLQHDFPSQWHRFTSGSVDFTATIGKEHFPYWVHGLELEVQGVELYSAVDGAMVSAALDSVPLGEMQDGLNDDGRYSLSLAEGAPLVRDAPEDLFLVIRYSAG